MNLVFMGTPDFAAASLSSLLKSEHRVLAVFTQPDKPKGRKGLLSPPPVKELALAHGIPVHQPATLKDGQAAAILQSLQPQVIVVTAYGKILPKDILNLPEKGCVNVHASLLPHLRGAGPIQWSILNGDQETGVTTMYMADGVDTGDMILKKVTPIGPDETAPELYDRLKEMGGSLLLETLSLMEQGAAPRIPQPMEGVSYAPMLTKELSPVDFSNPAQKVYAQIRGLAGWPVASFLFEGKTLKVHTASLAQGEGLPGQVLDPDGPVIACGQGAIRLVEVQYEGGRRMDARAFFRGHPLKKGQRL